MTARPVRFVRRLAVLGTALVAGTALAACSGGGGGANGDSGGASDTLTIAVNSAPVSFDPAHADNGNGVFFTQLAYEPLIRASSDGSLEPGLATDWGYVGDGNTQFEVTIRTDAKFADGDPVTAQAVADSLNYFVENATSPAAAAFAGITATPKGDDKVALASETANPALPQLLNQTFLAGDIVSPQGLETPDDLQSTPSGAGPYVLDSDETVAGDHYTYTANPNYWDPSIQHYKTIVLKVISSTTSALQALRTGQVDFMNGDAQTVNTAESAGLQIFHGPATWEGLFLLDREGTVVPALADVRVRQALNYAVDRDSIAEALYGEYGSPDVQPNTQGWDGYDESLEDAYPFDPDKAKDLLAEAGYADGFSMPVHYFAVGQTEAVMQAVADQLKDVGVSLELTPNPDLTSYVADLYSLKFAATGLTFGGQPQFVNVTQSFLPTSGLNPFGVDDPEFVQQFQQAAAAGEEDIEAAMRATMAPLVEQAYTLPVVQSDAIFFAREGLEGIEMNPQGSRVNPLDWTN